MNFSQKGDRVKCYRTWQDYQVARKEYGQINVHGKR